MSSIKFVSIVAIIVTLQACGDSNSNSSRSSAVQGATYTNSSDVTVAEKFLNDLPAACSASSASASSDGTINIRILCNGNGKSMDGLVSIKNGIVTKVR